MEEGHVVFLPALVSKVLWTPIALTILSDAAPAESSSTAAISCASKKPL